MSNQYQPNELVRLAWTRFRRVYRGVLSPIAFIVGDLLYEYASQLASQSTPIFSDYFSFTYNKEDIAKDIGVQVSSFRQRTKKRNGTVWEELEKAGFIFENGKKGKCSTIYIPIHNQSAINQLKTPTFYANRFGEDKNLEYIKNIEEKIHGTYEEKINRKLKDIDFTKENIKNYKLFHKDNILQKKAKLTRQILCLLAKNGFDVNKDGKTAYKMFGSLIKATTWSSENYPELIEKAIFKVYKYHKELDINAIYAMLNSILHEESFILHAQIAGYDENDVRKDLKKQRFENKKEKYTSVKNEDIERNIKLSEPDIETFPEPSDPFTGEIPEKDKNYPTNNYNDLNKVDTVTQYEKHPMINTEEFLEINQSFKNYFN